MIIALVVISIFLILSLFGNIILYHMINKIIQDMIEKRQLEQELAFFAGEIDIPEDEIAQKFLDATILYRVEKNKSDNDNSLDKIVDVSNYQKNKIIGLTYFVRPQFFETIKETFNPENIKEDIYPKIIDELYDNENDIDEVFINEILDRAVEDVLHNGKHIINEQFMVHPFPHCTVYQLKDGRWVWRQEEGL